MRSILLAVCFCACLTPTVAPVDVPLVEVAPGHWRAEIVPTSTSAMWRACTDGDRIALWTTGGRVAMLASGAPCISAESGALSDVVLRAGHQYRFVVVGDRPVMGLELPERSRASE